MKHLSAPELIKIVTDSFEAERTGSVEWGLSLIHSTFKRTGMYVHEDKVFPVSSSENIAKEIQKVYAVQGREFHVWNVAANEETQTVFVELAEVDPSHGKKQVWPYALVCQIENGKIKHSRHYGDPKTIKKGLSVERVQAAVTDGFNARKEHH